MLTSLDSIDLFDASLALVLRPTPHHASVWLLIATPYPHTFVHLLCQRGKIVGRRARSTCARTGPKLVRLARIN
jgi:hypothetical protein